MSNPVSNPLSMPAPLPYPASPAEVLSAAGVFSVHSGDALLARNKAHVIAFYDLMFNQCQPALAVERYAGDIYTQHNPEVPDGKAAFIAFFDKMAVEYPGKFIRFKRVFAEGDFVTLHGEHVFPGPEGGSWAAIDLFRLDAQGKLVEHWDVLQKVSGQSANGNGVF